MLHSSWGFIDRAQIHHQWPNSKSQSFTQALQTRQRQTSVRCCFWWEPYKESFMEAKGTLKKKPGWATERDMKKAQRKGPATLRESGERQSYGHNVIPNCLIIVSMWRTREAEERSDKARESALSSGAIRVRKGSLEAARVCLIKSVMQKIIGTLKFQGLVLGAKFVLTAPCPVERSGVKGRHLLAKQRKLRSEQKK